MHDRLRAFQDGAANHVRTQLQNQSKMKKKLQLIGHVLEKMALRVRGILFTDSSFNHHSLEFAS
jgi:hypothetical protein